MDPDDELAAALHKDDVEQVRQLLERHPDLKARLAAGASVVKARSPAMLDALLAAGADINAKSDWWAGGFGLLHGAKPELAVHAIARGAVVDVHAAARLGLIPELRALLAGDPGLVAARGGDGQTPLHFARSIEVAEILLEHGADLEARDVDHESTPAQYMVGDRLEVARYLVRRGARSDLLMAAALGDLALVRRHLEADPACIRLRVTDEYFPMIGSKCGGTIYQWTLGWYVSAHDVAQRRGHQAVYDWLMEQSPPEVQLLVVCSLPDESAASAQSSALRAAHPGLVERLTDSERRQVAHAARNNEAGVVRLLLEAGVPVDAVGQHRATPLHWAAFHGNPAMAREILRFHPPLEVTDADFGGTPLGWAIHGSEHGWYRDSGDYPATVEMLVRAGAKVPDKGGGTPAVQETLRRLTNR